MRQGGGAGVPGIAEVGDVLGVDGRVLRRARLRRGLDVVEAEAHLLAGSDLGRLVERPQRVAHRALQVEVVVPVGALEQDLGAPHHHRGGQPRRRARPLLDVARDLRVAGDLERALAHVGDVPVEADQELPGAEGPHVVVRVHGGLLDEPDGVGPQVGRLGAHPGPGVRVDRQDHGRPGREADQGEDRVAPGPPHRGIILNRRRPRNPPSGEGAPASRPWRARPAAARVTPRPARVR